MLFLFTGPAGWSCPMHLEGCEFKAWYVHASQIFHLHFTKVAEFLAKGSKASIKVT